MNVLVWYNIIINKNYLEFSQLVSTQDSECYLLRITTKTNTCNSVYKSTTRKQASNAGYSRTCFTEPWFVKRLKRLTYCSDFSNTLVHSQERTITSSSSILIKYYHHHHHHLVLGSYLVLIWFLVLVRSHIIFVYIMYVW